MDQAIRKRPLKKLRKCGRPAEENRFERAYCFRPEQEVPAGGDEVGESCKVVYRQSAAAAKHTLELPANGKAMPVSEEYHMDPTQKKKKKKKKGENSQTEPSSVKHKCICCRPSASPRKIFENSKHSAFLPKSSSRCSKVMESMTSGPSKSEQSSMAERRVTRERAQSRESLMHQQRVISNDFPSVAPAEEPVYEEYEDEIVYEEYEDEVEYDDLESATSQTRVIPEKEEHGSSEGDTWDENMTHKSEQYSNSESDYWGNLRIPEGGEYEDSEDSWDDYINPECDMEYSSGRISPPGCDYTSEFAGLIQRASEQFNVSLEKERKVTKVMSIKLEDWTTFSLPILKPILKSGMLTMKAPLSVPAVAYSQEDKYKIQKAAPEFIKGHPLLDSVVVTTAQRMSLTSLFRSVPPDKASRRIDLLAKKMAATASLSIRVGNTAALIARYNHEMWEKMKGLLEFFPPAQQAKAHALLQEGCLAAKHTLLTALDSADVGFRQMAHATVLRRYSWLQASEIHPNVQAQILNMPFDGTSLFGKHVDEALKAETDRA